MATHSAHKTSHGFVGDHPGLVATLFALAVTACFLFLLYQSATSHHEAGPAHGAAPAHGAPAAPPPAHH
jgi:hypothetical protein